MFTLKKFFQFKKSEKVCCEVDVFEMRVEVYFMRQVAIVTSMRDLFRCVRQYFRHLHGFDFFDNRNVAITFRGKLLNENKSLCDYVWGDSNLIKPTVYSCLGGSGFEITDYIGSGYTSFSVLLEQEMMVKNKYGDFVLQALQHEDPGTAECAKMFMFVRKHMARMTTNVDVLEVCENFFLTFKLFRKCECQDDYIVLACVAYKLFTGKSYTRFVQDKTASMFGTVQSDNVGDMLKQMRGMMDFATEVGENPFYKKMTGLYSYLLVQGFLTRFGFTLSNEEYSKMEIKAMQTQYSSRKNLWVSVLDTTLFICERIHEWRLTGDFSSFLHSDGEYSKWSNEADRILALAPFTSNLEAHNTTYFSFISDLNDAVEKGEAFSKFCKKAHGTGVQAITRKLAALQMLKNTEITKRATQKERKAPFGVLVHGGSSVGKSTFTKMLYYYYGSIMGLDKSDHFRYVRNPTDEYWSNFDSSKWCIQLDDIAFLLPKKSSEVDPTLKEMLNVVNNVPYVPAQAALEDKGRTPVMAKLVIATSNACDLNAKEYFWCPLAVQRRLPYVVNIEPKHEYLAHNRKFLDPSKLPVEKNGYPDYWNIKIQKVVPHFDGERDLAILEDVCEYKNIADFLVDFGKNAMQHDAIQDKSMDCDTYMRDIDVCVMCHRPGHKVCAGELQSEEVLIPEWAFSHNVPWQTSLCMSAANAWFQFYCWFLQVSYTMHILTYFARYRMLRKLIFRFLLPYVSPRMQITFAGVVNAYLTTPRKWKLAIGAVAGLTAGITLYYSLRPKQTTRPSDEKAATPVSSETKNDFSPQGNIFGTTEDQMVKEERQNVWYNPTVELNKFDVPEASASLNKTPDEVRNIFANNCVRLLIRRTFNGEKKTCSNAGVFVKGHFLVTNNHAFPPSDDGCYQLTVVKMSTAQGINSNTTIVVRERDLVRRTDRDLVLLDVRAMPPHKNILKFWSICDPARYTRAVKLTRGENGDLEKQELFALNFVPQMPIGELDIQLPIAIGKGGRETKKGDCGSLCVALTPRGPVIFGIHMLGFEEQTGIHCIDLKDIESMIEEHEERFGVYSVVQGDGEPMFNTSKKTNTLTVPHHKSLFRYLPEGTLNIYGSFSGFRPKPKSGVCDTPLQKEMLEHFQCKVGHGKPVMDGWEPWRKNVVEMVKPTVNYQKEILHMCVESFTADIIAGLPDHWEKQMLFLSPRASVNGLPGVKFIDRLNCNTSMGFPWNCTKRKYLVSDIDETYPDGVTFDEETWERVRAIEALYAEGKRAFPVFTGHLKDEPVTFAKIEAKKTRVFTGGPVDWSIVVRSRLLCFVKLLQENKYVFEAGPGTVCQSREWGQIREYLCSFGEDRIVAGDYGKFDKRMISDFILAAYRIIATVYEKAGFNPEEVREIMCIGADTAFPVVNVNGDLVEFFGTNPSGHPLTVIVNSLVNSLYMRYCYTILNPEKECWSFKENVKLMTYGDDNIMGVARNCDWFNHCDIQMTLASIGVEYTMADKESQSVPFINIADCQFLKRKWRYDEDVEEWLCPLEEESIHKSLTVWCPSKSIDEFEQMVAVISSANSEYFFYGRETFEKHHAFFSQILQREPYAHYVSSGTLPTWGQLVDRFNQAGR